MSKPRGPVGPGERATAPNGAPFPLRSWPPDAAIDIQNLANWADLLKPETVRRYASAAARDTAIPSPTDGMTCYLTDLKQTQIRIGSVWVPTGGVMPWAYVVYAGGSIPATGWSLLSGATTVQSGGAAWTINGSTGQVTFPYKGRWACSYKTTSSGLPTPGYVQHNIHLNGNPGVQYPTMIGQGAITAEMACTMILMISAAGTLLRPAIAGTGAAFTLAAGAYIHLQYLGEST